VTSQNGRARAWLAVATLAMVPLLSACGDEGRAASYPAEVAHRLQADVADIRAAAQQRKLYAARVALNRLTRHVADAQASGRLSASRAREILAAADAVRQDLAALPTPSPKDKDKGQQRPRPEPRREKAEGGEAHKGRGEKPKGRGSDRNGR
jgi:hypothetical protein